MGCATSIEAWAVRYWESGVQCGTGSLEYSVVLGVWSIVRYWESGVQCGTGVWNTVRYWGSGVQCGTGGLEYSAVLGVWSTVRA